MTPEQEIRLAALEVACDWAADKALEGRGHPGPGAVINTAARFERFLASGDTGVLSRCDETPEPARSVDEYTHFEVGDLDALRARLGTPTPLTDAMSRGLA